MDYPNVEEGETFASLTLLPRDHASEEETSEVGSEAGEPRPAVRGDDSKSTSPPIDTAKGKVLSCTREGTESHCTDDESDDMDMTMIAPSGTLEPSNDGEEEFNESKQLID